MDGPRDALEAGRTSVQFEIFGAISGMELIARSTVDDDLETDDLRGNAGSDWFLDFALDVVHDRGPSDR